MAETLPEAAAPGTGQQFKLVDVSTTPSEGGCGCGDHGQGTAHVVSQDPAVREDELVIHSLPKVVRHALLFAAMDNLPLGASLIVVAPHQPVPLFNYLQESESHYRVETIETGPVDWRYRVTRLS